MHLQGKKVFISGSSRGIGKAIAVEFAKSGAVVILNASKSQEELENTCLELKSLGYPCYSFMGDVSDYEVCKQIFKQILLQFGSIDILVANAGISYVGLFTEMTVAQYKHIIDVNLHSVFHLVHLALPSMIQQQKGVILAISSMWGEKGASCEAVYSASKGGVNAFIKSIAKEVGPSGIRANAIACGVIETQMNSFLTEEERDMLLEEIPLMRFGKVEEVAKLAVMLAGDEINYLTGQVITIDGAID